MIYLEELKNRFILLLLTVISTFLISYWYKEIILFLVVNPSYQNSANLNNFYFIFTDVIEIFYVYLQLSWFICFQFLFLYIIYHLVIFFSPALFFKEFKFLSEVSSFIFLIWIFLINLLNFLIIPLFWDFFLSFQGAKDDYVINLHFEAKLMEYLYFYFNLYYLFMSYLNIFVIMFFLFYHVIENLRLLKKIRKIVYFTLILVSTFLSPPDIISQFMLSFFTIFIYEFLFFILLIRVFLYR